MLSVWTSTTQARLSHGHVEHTVAIGQQLHATESRVPHSTNGTGNMIRDAELRSRAPRALPSTSVFGEASPGVESGLAKRPYCDSTSFSEPMTFLSDLRFFSLLVCS